MYFSIDCYKGNGERNYYRSDTISFTDENLNELINKFILAHKYFNFTKWKICFFTILYDQGCGVYEHSKPIIIKFLPNFKIQIDGIGEFQLEKPGTISTADEKK